MCTRAIRRGALTRAGIQGANRVAITGRLRGKRLRPGPYRATLRAKDAGGQRLGRAPRDVQDPAPALMARPVALEAASHVEARAGAVIGHLDGSVPDLSDWLSLQIQVEFELDDARRVSAPEPIYGIGGPLNCTRAEFEERVQSGPVR